MTAFRGHTGAKTTTPLFNCIVDHALVQAFPFLNDTLSQLVHSLDFLTVNSLLKNIPCSIIDWDEV